MHVKSYCFRNCSVAHPDSRRPQATDFSGPEETISNKGGIPAIEFQGQTVRRPGHRTQDTGEENDW